LAAVQLEHNAVRLSIVLHCASNNSLTQDTMKYFSRMSSKLVHSTNMCFTVSRSPQVTCQYCIKTVEQVQLVWCRG